MDQRAITPLSGAREADDPALATSKTDRLQRLHRRLLGWLYQEMIRQHGSRSMAAKCERYYDGHQLTDEQIADAKEAGLQPVVYNEVSPTIDWLIGTELRTRVDQFVTAEDEGEEAERDAEEKSKVMKYLSAVNREPFEFSAGVQDQLKAGIGWVEVGVSNDQDGALIYVGHMPWRSVLWDSIDCRADLADCRYVFRVKVVDSDVALGIFSTKAQRAAVQRAITSGDPTEMLRSLAGDDVPLEGADSLRADMMVDEGYDVSSGVSVDLYNTRERVMLIECWYRDYSRSDQLDPGEMGEMTGSKIRVAIFTESDMLLDEPSPFRHGKFPFVPIWGYRSAGTRLPYSPIRRMIGPQDAYNQRVLAALRAGMDRRIIAEKGAFDPRAMSIEEVSREMASVDGVAVVADGAVSGGKIREVANTQQAASLAQAADRDLMHLRTASGITSENRGLDTNASSGKAILAKADQGSILTAQLVENQSFARQLIGELKLSLIEQYMTQPRTVRVPGEGGQVERMRINTGGRTLDQMRAHFSIGEQAWKQSFAEAAFESLMQVMGQLAGPAPQVVINILDLIFEIHPHLPRKSAIVNRIRDINGQTAPDGRASPEQMAKQQQAAKVAEAKFKAEMAKLDADVAEAQARGEKLGAESVRTRLTAIYEAAQAAQVAIQVPGAMPVADQLLASAGFKDLDGSGTAAVVPEQAVQQAQPEPMQQMAELQQADGIGAGIETAAADGVRAPQQQF